MEDISLPDDTRVEDILADYFTKKIEGKDVESKEKHSDSQHSTKSKKSKKRKHKKKKKHKSRKTHSENEADEADSSADECWVEVTARGAKKDSAKNEAEEAESPNGEPKGKLASKSKLADTNLSPATEVETRQDMPDKEKDGASTNADKNRSSKSDHQRETMGKNRTDRVEPSKRSSRKSSLSTSPAESKGGSSSSDSEDDRRDTSKSEPSSSQSAHEGSSKKSTKKRGRSYRTKRCRSSGSSEDERDRQSKSRSPSPLHRDSSRRSGQHRSRSASKSRHNSRSKDSARDRSKSRDIKPNRSRDRSRSRRRSSRSRSRHRGYGSSHRSRSPMRSQAGSSRSQKRSESCRSSSPRRSTRAARSRSRRRSRSRHSHGKTPPRHSRGRPSPRRSRSRRRSESRHRPRQSPGHSPKRSRRSTSRDRRHARKSVSPKKQRKSRSRSRKRSTSRQKHSSRRSRSADRKHSEKRKTVERDKSSEEKSTSGETSLPGDIDISVTVLKKHSASKSSEEILGKDDTDGKKSLSDSDKNQVVLYGPFEEEDANFLDEEPSPERTASSLKPTQPEACSAAVGQNSISQLVTDNLDAVPLPEEPAVLPDDSQLEDMDISNPPSPAGALEVDDSLARPVPSREDTSSTVVPPKSETEAGSQQRAPSLNVDSFEEAGQKANLARAAIPWNYNEPQQPLLAPLAPPWVKPETTKPVGQVRPFVREVNPSSVHKGPLQAKQDGLAIAGTVVTAQALAEPSSTGKLGVLENTVKAADPASFPEVTAKLGPQAPFTAVPAVNMHGGLLYSATVMPVHIPFQFVGVPGQGQVTHGTPPPLPQEKPSPVTQEHQTSPLPAQLSPSRKMLTPEQSAPAATPPQNEGQVENMPLPSPSTKDPPSQLPEDSAADQVTDTAGNAMVTDQSNSLSRSSSPVEKERSRSNSKELSNSSRSRSCSGDRRTAKRSRSRESKSPSKDSKRLRKGDSGEREQIRAKSRSRDRHSASPDRSRHDSHVKKKSQSPDKKQSKGIDRRRSRSHERKSSKSLDRKRSKSRDRKGSKSRDRQRSSSRERKRSKSCDRKRSKSRDRKRSKSRERKRSKSWDRKGSKSRERRRSKSRERKRSKSREKRRSKSRDKRRSRSRDRRRSKSRDRHRSGSRGRQRTSRGSISRPRRSRSRDQPKRQSRSRETRRSRRSESRKRDSSRRKSSRERESPKGTLILKRYKNELSSDSDSSPERQSQQALCSPVKKRQRRESDAESTDSQDIKPRDERMQSPESSDAVNEDGAAEQCKDKELEKQQLSETLADKDMPEAAPYGPVPPTEASVGVSMSVPEPQSDNIEIDDKQDDKGGTDCFPQSNSASKASSMPAVSSSSSNENVCGLEEGSAMVGSSRSVEIRASTYDGALKLSEPLEQRQAIATSSSKSPVCGEAGAVPVQENAEDLSTGERNVHDPVTYKRSMVASGEAAVSSSTGSPREQEDIAESDKARCNAALCQKNTTEEASLPVTEPVTAYADSSKDSEAGKPAVLAKEQGDPSSTGDTNDTLDVRRKSRSRSVSSTSSVERARMRNESSSSSTSSSQEEQALKDGSKSRSVSPGSQSGEVLAEGKVKNTQSQDRKRSQSRGRNRSRSRDKRISRNKEKKRSLSREKKRSKSHEKRRSRSRDKSLRSKEKKRSKSRERKKSLSRERKRSPSRERKRSPSRDKRRSRSREKRRSRSREKLTGRSRDKRRSRSHERKRSLSRDNRDKRRSSREKRRSRSREKRRSRSRDKKRSLSRDRKRSRSRERRRSRDKKSRSRSREKRRSRSREKRRSRSRPRRSWSRAMELQRKRSAERLRKKSRSPRRRSLSKRSPRKKSRSRSRSRRRSRSHSPERKRKSRSRDREPSVVKVDKAQLLEAARKNMQAMLQRGVVAKGLPVAAAAAVNATVKVVAAAVAAAAADPRSSLAAKLDVTATPPSEAPVLPLAMSGDGTGPAVTLGITEEPPKVKKSLAALTEICKAISDEEKREYAGEVEPKTAEEVAEEFQQTHHHPFKLKDPPPPIRFNIPNATNLPVKTLAEKVADAAHLHKQFPVSSGSQHRVKELEWVPVEKTEPPAKAARGAAKSRREEGSTSPLALMPPPPAPTHLPPYPDTFTPLPTVAAAPPVFQMEEVLLPVSSAVISSTVMEPPEAPESLDIATIMTRRVEAMKALRENPMDLEAMQVYHNCHKEFQAWIASKQEPGQYTGSIDFKPLTPDELSGPTQAWVKKDQFMKAAPVCEGIGMYLLRKMGWTPGEGLGKNKEGTLEPLLPSIKTDKKGLVSELETKRPLLPAHHNLGGKHPVSALTELCIKSRWGPPEFTLAEESGPDHKKTFLFKVKVNGKEYQPCEPSANKKHAKAQAAMLCLQETGVIGRGYSQGLTGQLVVLPTHQDIDLLMY